MDIQDCACTGKTLSKHIRPAVLAVLAEGPTHGYDIMQRLEQIRLFSDVGAPDASGIYRALKLMEVEGLVSSDWELGDSGPARRQFTITGDGRDCLAQWVTTLTRYRDDLGQLLDVMKASMES